MSESSLNSTSAADHYAVKNTSRALKLPRNFALYLTLTIMLLSIPLFYFGNDIKAFLNRIHASGEPTLEPEKATIVGDVWKGQDPTASGGEFIRFGYQPSPPYYAAFYYPWYKNSATDGSYSYWQDNAHQPPNNWFSNYLPLAPGVDTANFDSTKAKGLYSTNDTATFYWQLSKFAEAHINVAISSWWGQGHKTDTALQHIVGDLMNRPDNPYPNLRWTIYYEKEGINTATNTAPNDPSVSEIAGDLTYLSTHAFNAPSYMKINGRPVVFVYADPNDGCAMADRWFQARQQSGIDVYIDLKVFSGYSTCSTQPDSWHQYAPGIRSGQHGAFSYFVSPGFWKNGSGVTLSRSLSEFTSAVTSMVAANTSWKLIETWNEWGEGTSVEPGVQVLQTTSGTAALDPNGTPFANVYIDVLSQKIPALKEGTGALAATSGQVAGASDEDGNHVATDRSFHEELGTILPNIPAFPSYPNATLVGSAEDNPAGATNNGYRIKWTTGDGVKAVIEWYEKQLAHSAWTFVAPNDRTSDGEQVAHITNGTYEGYIAGELEDHTTEIELDIKPIH